MYQAHTQSIEAIKYNESADLTNLGYGDAIESPPNWIEGKTTVGDLIEIVRGGCESGSYMPAVTYHQAAETMGEFGDEVTEWLENYGDPLSVLLEGAGELSWGGLCCKILSRAVEAYALTTLQDLFDNGRLDDETAKRVEELV